MKKFIVIGLLALIAFGRCTAQSGAVVSTYEEWTAQPDRQTTVDRITLQWESFNLHPSSIAHDDGSIVVAGSTAAVAVIVGDSITAVYYSSDVRKANFMGQLFVKNEILEIESAGYHFHVNGQTGYYQIYSSRWTDDGFVGATPTWRAVLDINQDIPSQIIAQNNLALLLDYNRGSMTMSTVIGNFEFPLQSVWSFPDGKLAIIYSDNFSYILIDGDEIKFYGE